MPDAGTMELVDLEEAIAHEAECESIPASKIVHGCSHVVAFHVNKGCKCGPRLKCAAWYTWVFRSGVVNWYCLECHTTRHRDDFEVRTV